MGAIRFIAWLVLGFAVALLGADAVSSLENGVPMLRTTGDIIGLFGLNASAWPEAAPEGVRSALSTVLELPLWAVLGPIGMVLTLVFRPIE